jgi:hypothetical protein
MKKQVLLSAMTLGLALHSLPATAITVEEAMEDGATTTQFEASGSEQSPGAPEAKPSTETQAAAQKAADQVKDDQMVLVELTVPFWRVGFQPDASVVHDLRSYSGMIGFGGVIRPWSTQGNFMKRVALYVSMQSPRPTQRENSPVFNIYAYTDPNATHVDCAGNHGACTTFTGPENIYKADGIVRFSGNMYTVGAIVPGWVGKRLMVEGRVNVKFVHENIGIQQDQLTSSTDEILAGGVGASFVLGHGAMAVATYDQKVLGSVGVKSLNFGFRMGVFNH